MNTLPNGEVSITTRICLAENPDEESVDINELDTQEMERLREVDPFMYHSIKREHRRSSLFGLEEEEEEDPAQEEAADVEFDFRDMDHGDERGIRGSLIRALSGFRRESLLTDADIDADTGAGGVPRRNERLASQNPPPLHAPNAIHGVQPTRRSRQLSTNDPNATLQPRRRSSIASLTSAGSSIMRRLRRQSSSTTNDTDDVDGGSGRAPRRNSRRFSQNLSQVNAPDAMHTMQASHRSSITSMTSTGSSIVKRKRRFSTEAHSSLIMSNLESSFRGSVLSDSPDLDSLLDEDLGGSDDEDLLSFLRSD